MLLPRRRIWNEAHKLNVVLSVLLQGQLSHICRFEPRSTELKKKKTQPPLPPRCPQHRACAVFGHNSLLARTVNVCLPYWETLDFGFTSPHLSASVNTAVVLRCWPGLMMICSTPQASHPFRLRGWQAHSFFGCAAPLPHTDPLQRSTSDPRRGLCWTYSNFGVQSKKKHPSLLLSAWNSLKLYSDLPTTGCVAVEFSQPHTLSRSERNSCCSIPKLHSSPLNCQTWKMD